MIRRDDATDWLLSSQVDHAHLAADVAAVWGNAEVAPLPVPEMLVPAIRDHDEGWHAWENAPQIDPESGRPRTFTEMPARTAAAIWTASIETCAGGSPSHAEALRRYADWLQANGGALTPEKASVLEAVLQFRGRFGISDMRAALRGHDFAPSDRAGLLILLNDLTASGVVRCARNLLRDRALCEAAVARIGQSPLGGLWVSRHFCWLAERAKESRAGDEAAAADRFLEQQSRRQAEWSGDAVRQFAGEHLDRLLFAGFRYVQFFDQLSLWLCVAPRTDPHGIELPNGHQITFTPRTPTEIAVAPWPLSTPSLQLSAPARRIPARTYADDPDLHRTLRAAPTEELRWTLLPPA